MNMKNDKKTGRSVHQNVKTLEEAVATFIADVENRLDERKKSTNTGWYPLTDVERYLDQLKASYAAHRGEAPEVPRKDYERTVQRSVTGRDEVVEKHESYGLVSINRVSGFRRLFGSSIRHQHFFSIRVMRGQRQAGEWGEHFRTDGRVPIVSFDLSPAQFVELITTQNIGEGVPCTITDVEGVRMDPTPDDAGSELKMMKEQFEARFTDTVASMGKKLKEVDALLEKKSLTKDDKVAIRSILNAGYRMMSDSAPHTLKIFGEHTEKMIAKGKLEVESFIMLAIQKAGIKSIKDSDGRLVLGDGDDENKD